MSKPAERKKAFVFVMAASGHMNPVTGIVSELVKQNVDITYYSMPQFKSLVEKSGAKYKEYSFYPDSFVNRKGVQESKNTLFEIFASAFEMSYRVLPGLIDDVEKEKPDLIIYDHPMYFGVHLKEILRRRYENEPEKESKSPKFVEIATLFPFKAGVYPNNEQIKGYTKDKDIRAFYYLFLMFFYQFGVCIKYGLNHWNPIKFMRLPAQVVIATVFPQLQPMQSKYEKSKYKFVGCCIEESVRKLDIQDSRLQQVLDDYEPVNPLVDSIQQRLKSNKRLVYMSLGTMDNKNSFIFYKVIEAIKMLESKEKNQFKITVVMALGDDFYKEIQERIKSKTYYVPDYFVLVKFAPQIEILKRASLFISHVGMNSLSETIHFGVPVIAIPIAMDQFCNAQRIADELGLGKRYDLFNLDEYELSEGIHEMLNDETYLERMILMAKISRRHNGVKNGAEEILNILNKDQ